MIIFLDYLIQYFADLFANLVDNLVALSSEQCYEEMTGKQKLDFVGGNVCI